MITVQYHPTTGVCLADLSRLLSLYASRSVKVGAFSAASNVTGILTAANSVSALMHRAGGLVFFDYATAAPYVKVKKHGERIHYSSARWNIFYSPFDPLTKSSSFLQYYAAS